MLKLMKCMWVLAALSAGFAQAAVMNFETKPAFSCEGPFNGGPASSSDSGMNYTIGFAACYYSPGDPADFPSVPPSVVMASGFADITFSPVGGGVFDVSSVDLAFGPFAHSNLASDTTRVTGSVNGGGTLTVDLTVDFSFDTYVLNWTNLVSLTFSQLQNGSEYLAFDNMVFAVNDVPESGTAYYAVLALLGLAAMRSRRRTA